MEKTRSETDERRNFIEKLILGRNIDMHDQDKVVTKCIRLAYNDMLSAGRYYVDITKKGNDICNRVQSIFKDQYYCFSRDCIDEVAGCFGSHGTICSEKNKQRYVTSYGMAQKIVNMSYKYFYTFNDYLEEKNIDFSTCDCPIDSVILKKLPKIDNPWSKITKKEYEKCQENIKEQIEADPLFDVIGNMAFDFTNW